MKTLKKLRLFDADITRNDILSKKAQKHFMGGYGNGDGEWKCEWASCQIGDPLMCCGDPFDRFCCDAYSCSGSWPPPPC